MSSDYEYSDEEADDVFDEDDDMDVYEDDTDGDDGMDLDDFKAPTKASRKAWDIEYDSLSQTAIQALMSKDVEHIQGIFGVDAASASLLLRHSSWNKEKLIEKYMDNPDKTLVAAGVMLPEVEPARPSRRPVRKAKTPDPATFTCPVCFDDDPEIHPLALDCKHQYCSNCWSAYLTAKIKDEGEHACRCMAEGCGLVASDKFIANTVDEDTLVRFNELLVRHYVGCMSHLKFCPYPSCTNTVSCPAASSKSTLTSVVPIVSCGARGIGSTAGLSQSQELAKQATGKEHKFCFGCVIDSDHRPVVCGVALLWLKKCRDDSETANWIKTNTKECPKCMSTIEKNGGCNHMTCKKCKHEFCWVCMGPWTEHGTQWYSCNRYEEKAGADARDAQSKSRASLERYLHYYNRWANHEQSAKLAQDLFAKTEKKMEEMQLTSTLTWIEVQFMKKAGEELDKCRTTLKWTYAMAYYLAKSNEKDLFEDNQRDLEQAVEDLSELLESPIEPENIPALRQKVTDKTVYVQKRNAIVLEDTADGFLDGRWKWNVAVDGFDAPAGDEAV
ncbi:unnamed protein product [Mycena citricolor]|uniref:RBR-type E3 ubiquitin transferase n=1 Tax=Mycena citricolor TaxID=2018698 RepID=A0AAD2GXQ4_9AGAR|nr:unnamed protein product [Mycena citricolor]CAK5281083.1 unnamed protein product [Mycena citricolor]